MTEAWRPPSRAEEGKRSTSSGTAVSSRLWLSQAATQIGGNMVLFGLTVIVFELDRIERPRSAC